MAKTKPKKKAKKETRGRKLSLTSKIIKEICDLALKGNFRQDIWARMKLDANLCNSWLTYGKKELREESATGKKPGLRAKLVLDLAHAEAESRGKLMEDVRGSEDDRVKLNFLKMRYGRHFANADTYLDDDTGEEKERPMRDLLAERLAKFLKD